MAIKKASQASSYMKKISSLEEKVSSNIPRFYQILGEIFAFVLSALNEISQGFKTFESI
jgi:hypothetical protein